MRIYVTKTRVKVKGVEKNCKMCQQFATSGAPKQVKAVETVYPSRNSV